jgi:Holliday junction resolvasome RuvABC ATP-dependent DNA helicase subunit
METFFQCNPGVSSRVAHHVEFPDYTDAELLAIAERMLERMQYRLSEAGRAALADYVALRRGQPRFANARSIRNALDRARLRHASRLFEALRPDLGRDELMTLDAEDIRRSRVFSRGSP